MRALKCRCGYLSDDQLSLAADALRRTGLFTLARLIDDLAEIGRTE